MSTRASRRIARPFRSPWRLAALSVTLAFGLVLPPAATGQSIADMSHQPVQVDVTRAEAAGKRAEVHLAAPPVPIAFNGVVLRGFASDGQARGWIRFSENGDDWHPLYIVFSATSGTFLAAYRGEDLYEGAAFALRFDVAAGIDFRIEEAGVFDTRRDAAQVDGGAAAKATGGARDGLVIPPRLIRRSEWGAAAFRGDPAPLGYNGYDNITLHHAAGFGASTVEEGLEQVRRIQEFHQNGRGWSDIGYHFVADQSGNIYQGRPFLDPSKSLEEAPPLVLGAHAGGANTSNVGLCILGCFHPPAGIECRDVMSAAAQDSIVTMFGFLSERYGPRPEAIKGHRDFGSTACPGDNNYARLPEIRAAVATLLVTGNQPVGAATLTATSDEAGVVHLEWAFHEDRGIAGYRIERAYFDQVDVVYEATGAAPDAFTDRSLSVPGHVVYRLLAVSPTGQTQVLAVAQAQVTPPDAYALAGNFPNPFSASTTIRYYLQQDGVVQLRVYDLTGREVAVVADGFHEGDRWHYHVFDGSHLPAGTYVYRVQVEGFSGTVFETARSFVIVR